MTVGVVGVIMLMVNLMVDSQPLAMGLVLFAVTLAIVRREDGRPAAHETPQGRMTGVH